VVVGGYLKEVTTRKKASNTPQTSPLPGREAEMHVNPNGGYSFNPSLETRLTRWLILGSESNTYYQTAKELTKENVGVVREALKANGPDTVRLIRDISDAGRAIKNEPALLALAVALCEGDLATKAAVRENFNAIVRTGTHLFHFVAYATGMRGWGRGLRTVVQGWYWNKSVDSIGYQMVKYPSRDDWAHRDLLRLAHVNPGGVPHRSLLYKWATRGLEGISHERATFGANAMNDPRLLPPVVQAREALLVAKDAPQVAHIVRKHKVPREAVPTQWMKEQVVWEALLEGAPFGMLVRNLATLTRNGVIAPFSNGERDVVARLSDTAGLQKARMHPAAILMAKLTYGQGGIGGKSKGGPFTPSQRVLDALDDAFYASFQYVTPSGKPTVVAIDKSGSMGGGEHKYGYGADTVADIPGFSAFEAACVMALVTIRTEPEWAVIGFDTSPVEIKLSAKMRLEDVLREANRVRSGNGTDCAVPIRWARNARIRAENFAVFTDGVTWAGPTHVSEELKRYRNETGLDARQATAYLAANNSSLSDPNSDWMMDFCGWDSAAPKLMAEFFGARIGAGVDEE
jgi:60 kDa SS-A/Ro ribonucleoprotein